jgi:hypothetical protein
MNLMVVHNQAQEGQVETNKNNIDPCDVSGVTEHEDNGSNCQDEFKNPSASSQGSLRTKTRRNDFPFELSKDYGNINGKIFRTDKQKNHVNFKVIKGREGKPLFDGLTAGLRNNIISDVSIGEGSDDYDEEKKKELERLLDDFMSSRKRRKSFMRDNYLDILICKLIESLTILAAAERWINQGYILETNITSCKDSSGDIFDTDNEPAGSSSPIKLLRNGKEFFITL